MEAPKQILLVEDNPGDARLLKEALKEFNHAPPFELVHVTSLSDGIKRIKQAGFEAVLLDLSLPDAQGVDTVVRMQREAVSLPIVVLTGLDDDSAAVEAVRAGAQDYLVKGHIDGRLLVRALSYAIERNRLQEAMQRHLDQITALKDINYALTSTLDLAQVLDTLMEKINGLMPDFSMTIRLRNRESGLLEPVACHNVDEQTWRGSGAQWRDGRGLARFVFETKKYLAVRDVENDPRILDVEFYRSNGWVSCLVIPLILNDEVLGTLAFLSKKAHEFSEFEIDFLSAVAALGSVAIHNSQSHGAMKKLASDLERANHVKDEFLGVMSHELRTPLNVVRGYVEMLQKGFFGELVRDQQEALAKVASQISIQSGMINNILNAVAMESEVAKARFEEISLHDFLDELRHAYPQPLDRKLEFRWKAAPDLPSVRSDKAKLHYILQNLINNAVKFTPEGVITVSVSMLPSDGSPFIGADSNDSDRRLLLEVADTGVGIEEEFLSIIFEKFSQADSSTTRVHEGVGLGLHIVKRCTELLKGEITVESRVGNGSTFRVTIPCAT